MGIIDNGGRQREGEGAIEVKNPQTQTQINQEFNKFSPTRMTPSIQFV